MTTPTIIAIATPASAVGQTLPPVDALPPDIVRLAVPKVISPAPEHFSYTHPVLS